eukprot:12281332-Prorocentrum_lima.AAC.1
MVQTAFLLFKHRKRTFAALFCDVKDAYYSAIREVIVPALLGNYSIEDKAQVRQMDPASVRRLGAM